MPVACGWLHTIGILRIVCNALGDEMHYRNVKGGIGYFFTRLVILELPWLKHFSVNIGLLSDLMMPLRRFLPRGIVVCGSDKGSLCTGPLPSDLSQFLPSFLL